MKPLISVRLAAAVVSGPRAEVTFALEAIGESHRLHDQGRQDGKRVGWDSTSYSIPVTTPGLAGTYAVTVG